MENRITGLHPQPITEDEVDLRDNEPAQELCEEVGLLTAEAREGLLEQALAVSNEKCNGLVLRLNAQTEELTQQVRNVEWTNAELVRKMKEENEKQRNEQKEGSEKLLSSLKITLQRITETVTEIERQVSIATVKATEEASELLKEKVTEAADSAKITIEEHSKEITKKVQILEKEIDRVREEIYYERGFRKIFFLDNAGIAFSTKYSNGNYADKIKK